MGKVVQLMFCVTCGIFAEDLCSVTNIEKMDPEPRNIVMQICNSDSKIIDLVARESYIAHFTEPTLVDLNKKSDRELIRAMLFDTTTFNKIAPEFIRGAVSFRDGLRNSIKQQIRYGHLTKGSIEMNLSFQTVSHAYEITFIPNPKIRILGFRVFQKSKI